MGRQRDRFSTSLPGTERIRYGFIGVGSMGQAHILAVNQIDDADIVAFADPFRDSLKQASDLLGANVPCYGDYGQMLKKEKLNAVVVATPNDTHAEIVCRALTGGLHVLGEKPMASSLDRCNRIVETARRSEGTYQIGLELRYAPAAQRLQEIVSGGEIGQVRQLWCKEFRGPWRQKVDQWITQKDRSGGTPVEKNCHHFDLFNWLLGERPVRVTGFGSRDLVYGSETFGVTPTVLDNAQVLVQYETGATAVLMLCMYCPSYDKKLEVGVIGTEGWIVAEWTSSPEAVGRMSRRDGGEVTTIALGAADKSGQPAYKKALLVREHLAFIESIRTSRRPQPDAMAGWWATVVGLAAERSVEDNAVVALEEFGKP